MVLRRSLRLFNLMDLVMNIKKYAIGAAVLFAALTAVYGYGQLQFRAGHSAAKKAQYLAELEQFKQQVIALDESAKRFAALSQQLTRQYTQLSKSYDEIINQNPLPSDCYIDDYRLRVINQAIRESASTGESSGTMPTD